MDDSHRGGDRPHGNPRARYKCTDKNAGPNEPALSCYGLQALGNRLADTATVSAAAQTQKRVACAQMHTDPCSALEHVRLEASNTIVFAPLIWHSSCLSLKPLGEARPFGEARPCSMRSRQPQPHPSTNTYIHRCFAHAHKHTNTQPSNLHTLTLPPHTLTLPREPH